MPTPGLSLVGFMDQPAAIRHLRIECAFAPDDDATLIAEWAKARAQLGVPFANAGQPGILAIPAAQQGHIQNLIGLPWIATHLPSYGPSLRWGMVEIAPLLAYQFSVTASRSQFHCAGLSTPPTMDEIFNCCLPLAQPQEKVQVLAQPNSMIVNARGLNVRLIGAGQLQPNIIGIAFGVALPVMHVVSYNGRYLLHNGFHRAYGLSQCGVTHIPALIRDVATAADAGIRADGVTFSEALLYSADAPTMGHLSAGRACAVQLRPHTRSIYVSWADYAVPESDL